MFLIFQKIVFFWFHEKYTKIKIIEISRKNKKDIFLIFMIHTRLVPPTTANDEPGGIFPSPAPPPLKIL